MPHVDPRLLRQLLDALGDEVYQFELSKGWQPNDNTFGDSLTLLHSEISEAFEAFREIGFQDRTREPVHLIGCPAAAENVSNALYTEHLCRCGALGKPDDVASELIDVFIRLLSTWHQWMAPEGFDMGQEYQRKMAYNATRAQRHGGKAL